MNYPNKLQSHPGLAADQPVFILVPNYNTQRRRIQDKKTWWRWDFMQRWRKVKGGDSVRANPNPPLATLLAVAPQVPEAAGKKLNNRAIDTRQRSSD